MTTIHEVLQRLGIFQTHQGYRYLYYGLQLTLEDEDYLLLLTKALYPRIALHFHTTSACVEHAIRNAVRSAWKRKGMQTRLEELSGYRFSKCPSNGEIICVLMNCLQRQEGQLREAAEL